MVAANAPVFHLHPDEQYFPCSVEFFLEQARLCIMRNVLMRRKIERGQCPPPPPPPAPSFQAVSNLSATHSMSRSRKHLQCACS